MKVPSLVKLTLIILKFSVILTKPNVDLLIYTFASVYTDGYLRLLRSAQIYNLKLQEPLGLGIDFPSNTVKISEFRTELKKYKDSYETVIMFVDSYDAMFTTGEEEILSAFYALNASIVFGAETNCYPIPSLMSSYPEIEHGFKEYRFLNSGSFMGYAPDMYELLLIPIRNTEDQLHYTTLFLDEGVRTAFDIILDTQATIFQNLHNAVDHVSLVYLDNDTKLYNNATQSTPAVVHGNGGAKQNVHRFSNYLAKSWTLTGGCLSCNDYRVNLSSISEENYPSVFLGYFIERPTPFLEEKLNQVSNLAYPKQRIFLFVFNMIESHNSIVAKWFAQHNSEYASAELIQPSQFNGTIQEIRTQAINLCKNLTLDYYLSIDSEVYIENLNTLSLLVSYNRTMIAPMMLEPGTTRSTFWGEITDDFGYIEYFDYQHIIKRTRRGIWNIAQVSHIYLLANFFLLHVDIDHYVGNNTKHPDVAVSSLVRQVLSYSMFLHVTNLDYYGHLSNMEYVPMDNLNTDLWQVKTNPTGWEKKYLHPLFHEQIKQKFSNTTKVCPDVYVFPLFTSRFCQEMISVVKSNGKWSDGTNADRRLYSGYEFIPAIDIHMKQIDYNKEWSFIIKKYIKSTVESLYSGYHSEGKSESNFVVRQDANSSLLTKSHYDSSTYTATVALNEKLTEYQGGEILFSRYNCSIDYIPIGWALMHPGRLTHSHKARIVTNGTRYSLISFIDP